MNLLKRIWRRLMWDRDVARLNAQHTVHKLHVQRVIDRCNKFERLSETANANLHEAEVENAHLREKLRERKRHLRIANLALEMKALQVQALQHDRANMIKHSEQTESALRDEINRLGKDLQSVINDYNTLSQTSHPMTGDVRTLTGMDDK